MPLDITQTLKDKIKKQVKTTKKVKDIIEGEAGETEEELEGKE